MTQKQSRLIHFRPTQRKLFSRPRSRFSFLKNIPGILGGFLQKSSQQGWKKIVLRIILTGFVTGCLFIGYLWITLPDLSDPASLIASQSTVITDRNGVELYRVYSEEDRTYIEGERIPDHMKQAMLSIEDERFFDRGCIDVRAILRAVIANLFDFASQGGSTITQQLARNALLTREKRISRKVKELMLACQLEAEFSKDELLELYLNWIPFGQNAYGIEQASQVYFGVSAEDLTLAQSSVLAALPQRPTYFNPYGSHLRTDVSDAVEQAVIDGDITSSKDISDDDVIIGLLGAMVGTGETLVYIGGRTDQVLRNMEDQGFITPEQGSGALAELREMTFTATRENIRAPHFVLSVLDEVEEMFAGTLEEGILERGGLHIETTLDWRLQEAAEDSVAFHRDDILNRFGARNMALVSMDSATKEIVAYVGNMDFSDTEHGGKIDMAKSPRQPGSSFKPFIYLAAFQNGYNPATPLWDVPTKIGDNRPQNFDGLFVGLQTIRQALGASRNVPAAKAFFLGGGEDTILELVSSLGAPSPLSRKQELKRERGEFDYGWPLALGAAETPLLEMVQAYGALASGGKPVSSVRIRKITDKHGNILFEDRSEQIDRAVIDPRLAYQVTSILSDETARPEEYWKSQLTIPGYETAAKTGTSNKCLEWTPIDPNTGRHLSNALTGTGADIEGPRACKLRKPDNAWLVGYTPNLVTGVWVGNANSAAMFADAGGLNTASPIWRDYMIKAHRKLETTRPVFKVPEGIVQPQVSMLSGEFPTECTPVELRRADVFLEERAPSQQDPACVQLKVDKLTNLLASESCPEEAQEEGYFLKAESLLPERWPTWEEGVQEWVSAQMELWTATENHSGAVIPLPIAPTEACDASLTPGRLVKPELTVVYPQPHGVVTYPSFKPRIDAEVGSSIRSVTYAIDGKELAKHESEPFDRALRVRSSIKKSGTHELTVTLEDEYFNQVSVSVPIRFGEDTGEPRVRFLKPTGDTSIKSGDMLMLRVDASDPDGGIKYVQFYLDDTLLTTKPREPFELQYKFDHPDGVYTVRAVAEDFAKNKAEDTVRITIGDAPNPTPNPNPTPDPVAPSLSLLSPATTSPGTTVDIQAVVPEGSDFFEAMLRVTNALGFEEVLLRLDEGADGTFKRQWNAAAPDTYTVELVFITQQREEEVVESTVVTVSE